MPQWALLLLGSIVGIGFVAGARTGGAACVRVWANRRAWGGLDGTTAGHLMSTSGDTSSGNGADGGGSR
jgi:hypothetical protein